MLPVTRRWARFGPTDPRWFAHVPEDGCCLSAFVLVTDRRGGLLLGRARPHRDWPEKGCMPLWRLRQVAGHGEWTLPASHLLMDESPDAAARRVARDWAGYARSRPRLVTVTSELMPTGQFRRDGGKRVPRLHWAICFLYELRSSRKPAPRPGWSELRFFSPTALRGLSIGRGHRDLLSAYQRARSAPPRSAPTRRR